MIISKVSFYSFDIEVRNRYENVVKRVKNTTINEYCPNLIALQTAYFKVFTNPCINDNSFKIYIFSKNLFVYLKFLINLVCKVYKHLVNISTFLKPKYYHILSAIQLILNDNFFSKYCFYYDLYNKNHQIKILLRIMQRTLSLSRHGNSLDQNLYQTIKRKSQQQLQNILKFKPSTQIKNKKGNISNQETKSLLKGTIKREILSSFQKCHTKVQNINAIYNEKLQITKKRHPHFSMKKFNPPSYFQTTNNFYTEKSQHIQKKSCQKLAKLLATQKPQVLKLSNSQIKFKIKQCLQFEKQTQRPFYKSLRKLQLQQSCKTLPVNNTSDMQAKIQKQKMRKTHGFQSYSQHKLLNPQKLARFSSQMNIHKIDLKKYKQKNLSSNLNFDKFIDKIKTKFDRDCLPWIIKLNYQPNDAVTRGSKTMRTFSKQSPRKANEVHSKYPIRMAV